MKTEKEKKISKEQGRRLKEIREQRGVTQEALSKYLGVTFQQVQKYESGADRISLPKLVMICIALAATHEQREEYLHYISALWWVEQNEFLGEEK